MDTKYLDQLEEQIQVEYEEKMNAIKVLRGVGAGGGPITGRKPRGRVSLAGLSEEEKKEKKREYMRQWYAKRNAGLTGRGKKNDEDKGLPPGKFKKFLHKGPISSGGTGD